MPSWSDRLEDALTAVRDIATREVYGLHSDVAAAEKERSAGDSDWQPLMRNWAESDWTEGDTAAEFLALLTNVFYGNATQCSVGDIYDDIDHRGASTVLAKFSKAFNSALYWADARAAKWVAAQQAKDEAALAQPIKTEFNLTAAGRSVLEKLGLDAGDIDTFLEAQGVPVVEAEIADHKVDIPFVVSGPISGELQVTESACDDGQSVYLSMTDLSKEQTGASMWLDAQGVRELRYRLDWMLENHLQMKESK